MFMLSPILIAKVVLEMSELCPQKFFFTKKMAETRRHDWPGVYITIKRGGNLDSL